MGESRNVKWKAKAVVVNLISERVKCNSKSIKHNKGHFLMPTPTINKKYNSYEYLLVWIKPHNILHYKLETIVDAKIIWGYWQCKTNQVAKK